MAAPKLSYTDRVNMQRQAGRLMLASRDARRRGDKFEADLYKAEANKTVTRSLQSRKKKKAAPKKARTISPKKRSR